MVSTVIILIPSMTNVRQSQTNYFIEKILYGAHWLGRDGIESCDVLPNIPKASTVQLILYAGKSHLSLIIYVCFGKGVLRHKENRHKSVTPCLTPPLWG